MLIRDTVRNWLAARLERLADWALEASRRLRVCHACGRNVFYGRGCAL